MDAKTVTLTLTADELALLVEALDSHEYWQLTEQDDRNDGYSQVEDGESAEIDQCRALYRKLEEISNKLSPEN